MQGCLVGFVSFPHPFLSLLRPSTPSFTLTLSLPRTALQSPPPPSPAAQPLALLPTARSAPSEGARSSCAAARPSPSLLPPTSTYAPHTVFTLNIKLSKGTQKYCSLVESHLSLAFKAGTKSTSHPAFHPLLSLFPYFRHISATMQFSTLPPSFLPIAMPAC